MTRSGAEGTVTAGERAVELAWGAHHDERCHRTFYAFRDGRDAALSSASSAFATLCTRSSRLLERLTVRGAALHRAALHDSARQAGASSAEHARGGQVCTSWTTPCHKRRTIRECLSGSEPSLTVFFCVHLRQQNLAKTRCEPRFLYPGLRLFSLFLVA